MNTCIADSDFLFCKADQLSFSGDYPVLPSDKSGLADTIRCYKIESYSEFPSFVRLGSWGEMRYSWKHKEYKISRKINQYIYLIMDRNKALNLFIDLKYGELDKNKLQKVFSGPAIKHR